MSDVYQTVSWLAKTPNEMGTLLAAAGITGTEYSRLTGTEVWGPVVSPRMHTVLEAVIYGASRLNHYVDLDLPSDYVAMVIATFVSPVNQMTACHTFRKAYNRDDLESQNDVSVSALKPINPNKLFAMVTRWNNYISGNEESQKIRNNVHTLMEEARKAPK